LEWSRAVQLPVTFRVELLDEIDQFLAVSSPGSEVLTQCVIDLIEAFGDENGIDDIQSALEDSGELDAPLQDALENEFITNENFHHTGEDTIYMLEQLCDIDWIDDADFDDLDMGEQ
jgi:hypothetical protein